MQGAGSQSAGRRRFSGDEVRVALAAKCHLHSERSPLEGSPAPSSALLRRDS